MSPEREFSHPNHTSHTHKRIHTHTHTHSISTATAFACLRPDKGERACETSNMFSPPDLGVLAAAFHPNGLSNTNNTGANGRFSQTTNSDEAGGNNFNNGFFSRQSAFSSPEKGILSPRQNSYVGVTGELDRTIPLFYLYSFIHLVRNYTKVDGPCILIKRQINSFFSIGHNGSFMG